MSTPLHLEKRARAIRAKLAKTERARFSATQRQGDLALTVQQRRDVAGDREVHAKTHEPVSLGIRDLKPAALLRDSIARHGATIEKVGLRPHHGSAQCQLLADQKRGRPFPWACCDNTPALRP
jgi:hypothetical protein